MYDMVPQVLHTFQHSPLSGKRPGLRAVSPIENKRAPKHATRFIGAKAGSPESGDTEARRNPHSSPARDNEVLGGMKGQPAKAGQSA